MAYENNECGEFIRRTRYGRNILCPRDGTHLVIWNGRPVMKSHWDAAMRRPETDKPHCMCKAHAERATRSRAGAAVVKL